MSVTDPLLKILKGHLLSLTSSQPIEDSRYDLQRFCEILELILRKGLRQNVSLLDLLPRDYIHCFYSLIKDPNLHHKNKHLFISVIDSVRLSTKVTTNQGKGRYFIRLALQKQIFYDLIQQLIQSHEVLVTWFIRDVSILRHDILSEIFLSCLMQLKELKFQLCLENHAFLDETWKMPIYKSISFVPSNKLGLQLHHCNGRIIVVEAEDGGLIGDLVIEEGDVLDSLCGHALRNCLKGDIASILKRHKNQPATLSIIKSRLNNNEIFPPISTLLKEASRQGCKLKFGENLEAEKQEDEGVIPPHAILYDFDQLPVHSAVDKAIYECFYLGSTYLGSNGSVDQIENIVKTVLQQSRQQEVRKVSVLIGEKDVNVTELSSQKILLSSSFTKISACGRTDDFSTYFCYIEGETSCTISKDFNGHVFQAASYDIAKIIMLAIAQGFERTHWFV